MNSLLDGGFVMLWMRRVSVMSAIVMAVAASACGSKASSKASSGAPAPTTSTTAAKSRAKGGVTVDLTLTGGDAMVIKGTKGRCSLPSANVAGASYDFEAADYPALGSGGVFSVSVPTSNASAGNPAQAYIKAILGSHGYLTNADGITFSSDYKTVSIDKDMVGGTSTQQVTTHVKGTITCS